MSTSTPAARGGGAWIMLVVILLAAVVVSNLVLLRVAAADPSVAAEPDAYRKAERWDEDLAARDRSARLGWSAGLDAALAPEGDLDLRLRIADAAGAPVAGATLAVEAFAVARSARRVVLEATTDADGAAAFRIPQSPGGAWEFRLRATRGIDTFVSTRRAQVRPATP